ncbi:MAG: hypothetical protein AAGD14_14700 [Planctomycetota bacterium]
MTEDPVKLYVVVMAILVGVLGYVANTSYKQANAFEQAIEQAPQDAKKFRELSANVMGLIKQLESSKLAKMNHTQLIENASEVKLRGKRPLNRDQRRVKGTNAKELTWKVAIQRGRRGSGAGPVTRMDVANFGRQVELESRGILKVIEIELRRSVGGSDVKVGDDVEIRDEKYTGNVVVGMRVVD